MSGIAKTLKKIVPKEDKLTSSLLKSQHKMEKGWENSILPKAQQPVAAAAIPMPDEEELERVNRRRNSRRAGGRASTVLTEEDRLG